MSENYAIVNLKICVLSLFVFLCDQVGLFFLQDEYTKAQEAKKKEQEQVQEAQKTPEELKQEELQKIDQQIAEMEVRKGSHFMQIFSMLYVYSL